MKKNNIRISVIGLGYVGLPLAIELSKYFYVTGFDKSHSRIKDLNNGIDKTKEITKKDLKSANQLSLTTSVSDCRNSNFYIVTVPTPITDSNIPDTEPLESACNLIGSVMKEGDVIIFESTVYPGMTEEFCVPILEKVSNLQYPIQFQCGYSPERINPGDKKNSLRSITKIVSGTDVATRNKIKFIYSKVIDAGIYEASSIKVAEAAKVIENVQRDVNIALVNELSHIFHKLDIDTNEVIDAASSKWNFSGYRPGLVGGHCIGVDPYYLTYKAQQVGHYPRIILSGRGINEDMPSFAASLLIKKMIDRGIKIKNQKVLILGLTFKENCPDLRNSKVFNLIQELQSFNLMIDVFDPYHKKNTFLLSDADVLNEFPKKNNIYSAIVLAVPHSLICKYGPQKIKSLGQKNSVFFDLKGIFDIQESDLRL